MGCGAVRELEVMEVKMTEREKMLAGQFYVCGDPQLFNQWQKWMVVYFRSIFFL